MSRRRPAESSETRTHLERCAQCFGAVQYREAVIITVPKEMVGQYLHRGNCAWKMRDYMAFHRVRIEGHFVSGNDGTEGVRVATLPELFKVPA